MTQAKVLEIKFYTVDDVMKMLGVGKTKAYEVIKELNSELEEMGKLTINGKINKKFFDDKIF